MSPIANPRTTAITADDLTAEALSSLNRRVSVLERNGGGGLTIIGGSSGGSGLPAGGSLNKILTHDGTGASWSADVKLGTDGVSLSRSAAGMMDLLGLGGSQTQVRITTPLTGQEAGLSFHDGTAETWRLYKQIFDNDFAIFNSTLATTEMKFISSTGGIQMPALPDASAGSALDATAPVLWDGATKAKVRIQISHSQGFSGGIANRGQPNNDRITTDTVNGASGGFTQWEGYAFRALSGPGFQDRGTLCGFVSDITINEVCPSIAITSVAAGANPAIVCATPPASWNGPYPQPLQVGDAVYITGTSTALDFNIWLVATVTDATHFSITAPSTAGSATGTVRKQVYHETSSMISRVTTNARGSYSIAAEIDNTVNVAARTACAYLSLAPTVSPAAWNHAEIFGANSAWLKTAGRGLWIANNGTQQAGTAIYLSDVGPGWKSGLVLNTDNAPDATGLDVFTLRGDGSVFVGPNLNADVLGGSIQGIALNYSATNPTLRVMGDGNNSYIGISQTGDAVSRVRLTSQNRLEWGNTDQMPIANLFMTAGAAATVALATGGLSNATNPPPDPITFTGTSTGWPASGFFAIGNETFGYNAIVGQTFTGITRTGTPVGATTHSTGDTIRNVTSLLRMNNQLQVDGKLFLGTATLDSFRRTAQLSMPFSTFKNGDNGTRNSIAHNDLITTDAAFVDGTAWQPILVNTTFDHIGSYGGISSIATISEYSDGVSDKYGELFSFVGALTVNRRGSHCGNEAGITINDTSGGSRRGPARAVGYQAIVNDHNTYASYASNTIFGAGSVWQQTGALGFRAVSGTQRGGTGLWIGGGYAQANATTADWYRAIVVNSGANVTGNIAGTDVFCVDGWGSVGIGVTVDQTNNTTGLPAKLCFAADTVAAGGVRFGTDLLVYRSGVAALTIESTLRVKTNFRVTNTGGTLGFFGVTPVTKAAAYTLTNHTAKRTLNETGDTLAQVANTLGTLVADLQAYGLIG